ncbi:MAG: hypothetical protein MZW92_17585 [Comamonadaceae bacterium]|nr:hypothetical protein [Comamonadaceae bacterium]
MLLFLHGSGCWRSLDKRDFAFLVPAFVDAGVSVAIVNYGLAPQVASGHRAPDAARLRLGVAQLHGIRCRSGSHLRRAHSAGAQLAAMMLAAEWPTYARDLPPDLLRGAAGQRHLRPGAARRCHVPQGGPAARHGGRAPVEPAALSAAPRDPVLHRDRGTRERRVPTPEPAHRRSLAECFARDVPLPGCNHLTAIEQLGARGSALFEAALEMMHAA